MLGLSFKPNTDDLRDAPALDMARELTKRGAQIKVFDPVSMELAKAILKDVKYCKDEFDAVKDVDAAVFVTEWNEFRDLDLDKVKSLMKSQVVIDCRNIYEPSRMRDLGFTYHSVGR
jgi:UDPglucose 6-dehydrogenase